MTNESRDIKIIAFVGSARQGNYTAMALSVVAEELAAKAGVRVEIVQPEEYELRPPGLGQSKDVMQAIQERVKGATAVLFATPEYHGSMSSVTKLWIEHLGFPSVLAGKPAAILGVAAGAIGAIKSLEQLRSVLSHVGSLVLPGTVSVAQVRKAFDDSGACTDERVEKRLRDFASSVAEYIEQNICPRVALEQIVREE